MTRRSVVLGLALSLLTTPALGQPTRPTPMEQWKFDLLQRDLRHYSQWCPTAELALRFVQRYGVLGAANTAQGRFEATVSHPDTFFVLVFVPDSSMGRDRLMDFGDSTQTMRIGPLPSSPLVRASLFVHELKHAADDLFGSATTLHYRGFAFALAQDECLAYQQEAAFLNEASRGQWSQMILWSLARRDSIYGSLQPGRYREYTGCDQSDLDRLAVVFKIDPDEIQDLSTVYGLAVGYANVDRQYPNQSSEAMFRKVELTHTALHLP